MTKQGLKKWLIWKIGEFPLQYNSIELAEAVKIHRGMFPLCFTDTDIRQAIREINNEPHIYPEGIISIGGKYKIMTIEDLQTKINQDKAKYKTIKNNIDLWELRINMLKPQLEETIIRPDKECNCMFPNPDLDGICELCEGYTQAYEDKYADYKDKVKEKNQYE